MVELAKTHISITDESASAAGSTTLRPLFVFATEQDKVIDETTGEIASGTTKELANELLTVTSRTDAINSFGIPKFTEVNGTVQQGDELNEVGLYAMYDALGSTSIAYALRADIDLKQLQSSDEEPTSNVANNTRWLDIEDTSYGLFINKVDGTETKASKRWEQITDIVVIDELVNDKPGILAEEGQVAIYFKPLMSGNKQIGQKQLTFQAVNGFWYEIGSSEWKVAVAGGEYGQPNVYHNSHLSYPTDYVKGSIWVKTTATNNGINYSMKQYKSESDTWTSLTMPMYDTFVKAEAGLGTSLSAGSIMMKNDSETANVEFYKFTGTGFKKSSGEITGFTLANSKSLVITTAVGTATIAFTARAYTSAVVNDVITAGLSALSKYGFYSSINGNVVSINSSEGYAFTISGDADLLENIKFTAGEYDNWEVLAPFEVKETEPKAEATEGTLWFDDDYVIDIMENDGDEWKGYKNAHPQAKVYVTSAEPEETVNDSLWIDPSDSDYPVIYRLEDGVWEKLDTTDQSTPDGVVFADARAYASATEKGTFVLESDGSVTSNLLTSNFVEPDCVNPQSYPAGILLFNTRFSTNNVKKFVANPFVGKVDENGNYSIGSFNGNINNFAKLSRWVSASGNASDGSGLFGRKAQRKMIVNALAEAIVSNEDIRTTDIDIFFASCPGYPELDDELINLNTDKKEMFEIISDTPARLAPKGTLITKWGTNANNATSHGEDGRVLKNEYVTRQYPPMGLASNVDGSEVAVPTSTAKMKNLLVLPRGQICAGTENGQVTNLASVGYITDENEYSSVIVNDGLGEILVGQSINPIMPRRNTGLLFWGEYTENPSQTSSLADEHGIITILRLKRDLETSVQPFFFKINNEALRSDFHKVLQDVLDVYIGTGEIYDYTLVTDSSVNTTERIGRKELWASIAIEIAKGVEQIYLPIRVVATGALSNS